MLLNEKNKAFFDIQNDVTHHDIQLALREGYSNIEHVKRYTTTGMATDQGKTSNINALGIVAGALELTPPDVGTTTFRPPYTPTNIGKWNHKYLEVQLKQLLKIYNYTWTQAQTDGTLYWTISCGILIYKVDC